MVPDYSGVLGLRRSLKRFVLITANFFNNPQNRFLLLSVHSLSLRLLFVYCVFFSFHVTTTICRGLFEWRWRIKCLICIKVYRVLGRTYQDIQWPKPQCEPLQRSWVKFQVNLNYMYILDNKQSTNHNGGQSIWFLSKYQVFHHLRLFCNCVERDIYESVSYCLENMSSLFYLYHFRQNYESFGRSRREAIHCFN